MTGSSFSETEKLAKETSLGVRVRWGHSIIGGERRRTGIMAARVVLSVKMNKTKGPSATEISTGGNPAIPKTITQRETRTDASSLAGRR
jgi:hypothetical protein